MNYRTLLYLLGEVALAVAALMLVPFCLTFVFHEEKTPLAFGITICVLGIIALIAFLQRPKDRSLNGRSGFLVVAIAWLFLSLMGSLPFSLSGAITDYIDCLFETVSGFTTTGATILSDIESMPKSLLMWRSITQWIGGMGVLVFIIAVLPKGDPGVIHLIKAETPGPQFGKLVSKLRFSAQILYAIYVVLTILEAILLLIGGMNVFDAFLHAFSTAATGGFSSKTLSIGGYESLYIEIVVTIFMLIFSINFDLFYLILIGRVASVIRSEELRAFVIIVVVAITAISISLTVEGTYENFGESLRYSSFQVASVISTTGFATADYTTWPMMAQIILICLMLIGGCQGSTAGGLKVSRVVILFKSGLRNVTKTVSPRAVINVKLDGKALSEDVVDNVNSYIVLYSIIFFASLVMISIGLKTNFTDGFSAVVSCLNNIGPGIGSLNPYGCAYGDFSIFSKIVLIFDMLIGRLEILPMLMLFYPKAWRRI